ncbi:thioredoxin [Anaerobiospirillum sp. NML120448]|uniref:thioredoxin n=1 Tax=Anaerobiospirillum sp. NML120448 TaxID=2932816 RepID=UPI001FF3A936|nr:thioredoxin [Anaerobiospirillum sp. NML120448]MCK0515051.1 thioredoxin [Anaerobiospirillum sp. NML120448]
MSDKIVHLTDDTFESEVLKSDKPVLLDFWAPWCGPCRMVGPILDDLANEQDDVKICKINIDDHQQAATQWQVMSIPTLLVFKNGEMVGQRVGAISKADLKDFIAASLSK